MAEIRIPLYIPELEVLMADVNETKAKVEQLSAQIDDMQQRVQEDVDALKNQLAQAGIDAAVLDEVNQGLDSIANRVQQIDPDPANPPAAP